MRCWQLLRFVLCLAVSSSFATNADASPEHFVKALYVPFAAEQSRPTPRDKVYSQSLLALMQRNTNLAEGEVGHLDYDPLCSCQDFEPFIPQIHTRSLAHIVRAQVIFTNFGKKKALTLVLRQESGNWRVDDIFDAGNSLRAYLVKANDEAAKSR